MGIAQIVKEVNKKEGKNVIARGNEVLQVPRFTSKSLSLDAEMGGGVPRGRIISLTGPESSGKSVLALKMVAGFQQDYPDEEILWVDAEGAFDPSWAKALGADPEKVYIVRPEYSEQAFDIVTLAVDDNTGLVVIDSMAALSPKEEIEGEMEKFTVGLQARLNRKFFRKFQNTINDAKEGVIPSTLVYINHLNVKIGASTKPGMPPPMEEPGGKALKFFPSVKISIKAGDKYPMPRSNDEDVEPKAQAIKFYIEKNKTASPFRRGHFWFYFDTLDQYRTKGCYDRLEEVIRYARKLGIIQKRGSMYDLPDHNTGESISFRGTGAVAEHIRGNSEARKWVERKVLELVAGTGNPSNGVVTNGSGPQEVALEEEDNQTERDESSEESESEESSS